MGKNIPFAVLVILSLLFSTACQPETGTTDGKKSIVVTYSILGSLVKELAGDGANVTVSIPNGLDPHEWEPSAKDIEAINKADLVVQNGLGLEAGMEKTLERARNSGVRFFTASDYIDIRYVGEGEGIPSDDPDQVVGAPDPHLWLDPVAMKSVVSALVPILEEMGLDVTSRALSLKSRLEDLDGEIAGAVAVIPEEDRKLVTGHESMGYFARRYGFKVVGVIIPSLSTQAEVSAADLAALKRAIQENQVTAIFTELGTSSAVASAIASETGARVVELAPVTLPDDGSYFTLMRNIAGVIVSSLG